MSVSQFDHGYWYATDLKRFAAGLSIPSASALRKDELELAIRRFLRSAKIADSPKPSAPHLRSRVRDSELGLRLDRRVVRYTNDPATKAFLEREAAKLDPAFRHRSGAKYRLNRWREAQLRKGIAITYREVIDEYVRLSRLARPFKKIPHSRYINFISDFMAANPGVARAVMLNAWHRLKTMDCPKTYDAFTAALAKTTRRNI
jgi:hypothetical protein